MRLLRWSARLLAPCAICGAMVAPIPAVARDEARRNVAIPAGTLDEALRILARQTGIAVGGTDAGISRVRTPAVEGTYTPEQALRRLLAGSGYRAVRAGDNAWRIERAPVPRPTPAQRPAASQPPPIPAAPIIVSASKRNLMLVDYPGGVQVAQIDAPGTLPSQGLDDLLERYPQTSGTELGPGRNKIFVRGIADSSFNGPTQSTVGLYLGEQRLIYSAPNPELPLYDMQRVELLEGPQGTLYGAGALGGVIRMVPNAPDPGGATGTVWAGGGLTEHGEPGFGGAAMVNAPLGPRAAVRLLGYGARDGGYVADPGRGLRDINRSTTAGFRAAALVAPADGWQVTASAFGQRRRMHDGQYIDADLPGLQRTSAIAQPFDSDLVGGNVTVTGRLGGLDLVSITGVVRNTLDTRYDSSQLVGPGAVQAFDEARQISLLSHETRLVSPQGGRFTWLAGVSVLRNQDNYNQLVTNLTVGSNPPPFADIRYRISEYALFGEGSLRLTGSLSATLGGRAIYTRSQSRRFFAQNLAEDSDTAPVRFLPMAALAWHPSDDWLVYARYQRSYRTGGVTIERADDGTPIPTEFLPDQLQSLEAGTRVRLSGPVNGELAAAAFYTRWTDIQGDLVQAQGFPITRNLGDGWIAGLTASGRLRFAGGWHADAAIFANRSNIDRVTPSQTINTRSLPNVARFSGNAGLGIDLPVGRERTLTLDAGLRYVGPSYLDITPSDQVPQGDYFDSDLGATLHGASWTISLRATNLLGTRGNRFAFGNPFDVRFVHQATPLRPRSVQLAASWSY